VIKKEAKKISKYKNTTYVESENNSDASNNTGNWNHLNIIQKTRKSEQQGTTENILGNAYILQKVLK
jgi:hypothetical protein